MRFDRSLLGFMGVALVLSTLTTLILFGASSNGDVTVLTSEAPDSLPHEDKEFVFSVKAIAKRELNEVKVRFTTLTRVENEDILYIDREKVKNTAQGTVMNLVKIRRNMELAQENGIQPETWNGTVEWMNGTQTYRYDMYLYDFTEVFRVTAPPRIGLRSTSSYVGRRLGLHRRVLVVRSGRNQ